MASAAKLLCADGEFSWTSNKVVRTFVKFELHMYHAYVATDFRELMATSGSSNGKLRSAATSAIKCFLPSDSLVNLHTVCQAAYYVPKLLEAFGPLPLGNR